MYFFLHFQVQAEVAAGRDRQEPRRPLGGTDRARQGEVREQEVCTVYYNVKMYNMGSNRFDQIVNHFTDFHTIR